MQHLLQPDTTSYTAARKRRQRWYRIVTALAAVVVFCTTYALILPAITLEADCGIPAHTHTEKCCRQLCYDTQLVLRCTAEYELHSHTADCYDENGNIVCGYADVFLHTHTGDCYDDAGELVCTLPEVLPHEHDESCFPEAHTHTEECYTLQRGELICTLEEDTPGAEEILLPPGDGIALPVDPAPGAETLEVDLSVSDAAFAGENEALDAPEAEPSAGHLHTDACYEWTAVLTCQLEETSEEELEPVCGLTQLFPHVHDADCYDEEGNLCCGLLEVYAHQHDADCLEEIITPTDEQSLTCENDDPEHEHTFLCYGQWELVCDLEEHIHTAECYPEEEEASEDGETPEEPALSEEALPTYYCGKEEHEHTSLCFDWDGTLICPLEEHLHEDSCLVDNTISPEEMTEIITAFAQEIQALEMQSPLTDADFDALNDLLERLSQAHMDGTLEDTVYLALYQRVTALLPETLDGIAEAAEGNNWMLLRDSGWFEEYSDWGISPYSTYGVSLMAAAEGDNSPSSVQIDSPGGTNSEEDVTVSKTIAGTDIENVFDITLTVQTPQKIDEVISEPDMAVVIVMDISNTMNDNFGGVTRYKAAMDAAEDFLDNFAANNTLGVSKVGYVAFNTDAHEIFKLSPCTNETQANALKNTMRTSTGSIINANGYSVAHNRFTNIEGGLKMAQDMLAGVSNKNKFIILLTDGFPTTYLESGYKGYDPYDTTGRFYDHVLNVPCASGTSYSDEAAIRARNMAASIKNSGTTIFSIGVDVGGQTIQAYIESSEKLAKGDAKISIVDRTGTTYEIGSATSTDAYKNWLKTSIGSGYYYDSTNTDGLKKAYAQIFAQIKTTIETAAAADWVASDPIPSITPDEIDFIGLYDKDGTLRGDSLTGSYAVNAENTASYGDSTITWDLKKSGYTTETVEGKTIYSYELTYRIRLRNEDSAFEENKVYNTNGTTRLRYRVTQTVNGTTTMSETKTIDFPIPSVHGFLGELTFQKVDNYGKAVVGAEFTLHHADSCKICRGDKTQVEIADQKATSDAEGNVSFENIPSGHTYTLKETGIPPGYRVDGSQYTVTVAYDKVTVTVTDSGGNEKNWEGKIVNNTSYELPNTGGIGSMWYTISGALLMLSAGVGMYRYTRKRRRGGIRFFLKQNCPMHRNKKIFNSERNTTMRNAKKLFSLLLAAAMLFALSVPAFAAQEGTLTGGSITIDNAVDGQTYNAYQILYLESYNATSGAYAYKANSAWETWLKTQTTYVSIDAQGYVTWVKDADAAAFAKAAQVEAAKMTADATATATTTEVKFENLKLGYYLVDSTLGTLCSLDTTNPDVTIKEKNGVPTNKKEVQEDSKVNDSDKGWGDNNDADIGQTVNFQSTITAQAGAENYVFHDKMSEGLTYGSVTGITLNGTTVDAANYTVKTTELTDDCTFEVTFTQTFCDTLKANDKIVISYTATVNDKAVVGLNGNTNESWLNYGDKTNTKSTPKSETKTYTWDLEVLKYANGDESKVLKDAQFVLLNSAKTKAATVVNGKLTGWADVPAAGEDGTITWPANTVLTTNDNGKIEIDGLDADTYYLREIKAPAGYNKLTNDTEEKITGATEDTETKTLTYTTKVVKINNQSGTELPSTGGMGTTLFYVLGGVLVAAAAVLLITRKRMNANG